MAADERSADAGPSAEANDWLVIFATVAADECNARAAAEWSLKYAAAPSVGWDECPRADWMLSAAARAGVSGRDLIGVLHDVLTAFFEQRALTGKPTPEAVADVLTVGKAWADGEANQEDVQRVYERISHKERLASKIAFATRDAAIHAGIGADADKEDLALIWAACALGEHTGAVMREFAGNEKVLLLTAGIVRAYLPWESVAEALATSELSRRRRAEANAHGNS
jgi:hypothetical protein